MSSLRTKLRAGAATAVVTCLGLTGATLTAQADDASSATALGATPHGDVQLEKLDRGLVAATTADGVFLSWRLLANEVTGATEGGQTGLNFHVYRGHQKIATVTDSTNYLDAGADGSAIYTVKPVGRDGGTGRAATATPWASGHTDLPLTKPADGVTPMGEAYTYSANDMSVGDLDGDGALEYVVKWDPSNSKDVSQVGYTGTVYLDAYEADGTLLYRFDLGPNIRAGAHYTQFLVYDFDGDGAAEIMFKTAPGTSTVRFAPDGSVASEDFITMLPEDLAAGYSDTDDYRLSAAQYAERLAGVFQGWTTHPEVVSGQWPATLEEAWGIAPRWEYPLSAASATEAVNHFVDVYAPARSTRNVLRNFNGFVLDGPEYLTVFEGATGAELETVRYEPGRGDDGLMWGDYAMSRIEPGNRVDRFLAGVGYLDGSTPSAIFARGYYTRTTLAAYDWDGEHLSQRWFVDSGHAPMTNPFNDGPHGRDGTSPEWGTITTQGDHSLSVADVDADGRHEVVYGSATLDDDGSLLYSSFDDMPPQSAAPGTVARLGHGDAMHVTDIDPNRPGLEIWTAHEGGVWAPYGSAMRDAATGEVLFGTYSGRDTGRAMIGDVRADVPGLEVWASMPNGTEGSGTLSAAGSIVAPTTLGTNQSARWFADGTTAVVDGSGAATPTLRTFGGVALTMAGTLTNNGTKGNPSLVADVLGDWREEVLVRTADSSAIRMFTSTEVTDTKLYTLLHDPQYRAEVARQQTTYNQPSYPGFYLASDTDYRNVPVPDVRLP
ncbi:rhamnogalacturonan lyase [Antribacter gilvus]|uniref:rhamnogalacturonan lyase n=1 Tax=Antribacter gilvus TaxID=2304675 RepID=UPI000F783F6B|nr:rhamnogalacturonan lyase [Antribacter gilvus]